ncbi:MAG: aminotransferase class V-fold PLP-dependent enzyme, partial [Dehalococcoidia bacterium]
GHYSIRKSANLLGLGEKNVIYIPVDTYNRINIKALRKTIQNIKRNDLEKGKKTKIMSIIGIAGTTETGNIDNLMELGDIAREENAYFHVDAAWGGAALLVDEYKSLFQGIEKADSVAVDAHKLLYCPMAMGVVVFRNEKDLNHLKTISQYVNRPDSVDTGRFTIEGSRPFACLKLWASLKIIGRDGYRLLFRQAQEATSTFKRILEESGNFEILNHPDLFILNYRLVPKKIMEKLNEWAERKKTLSNNNDRKNLTKKIQKVNSVLNNLNILLQKSIRQDDTTFVSRTILESTPYRPQRIVVLRAVLINPLINNDILKKIVSTQNNIALRLIDQFEPIIKEAIA